jgi:hypothetical protein
MASSTRAVGVTTPVGAPLVGARASEWLHLIGDGYRTIRADQVGAGIAAGPPIFWRTTTTGAHKGRPYGGYSPTLSLH